MDAEFSSSGHSYYTLYSDTLPVSQILNMLIPWVEQFGVGGTSKSKEQWEFSFHWAFILEGARGTEPFCLPSLILSKEETKYVLPHTSSTIYSPIINKSNRPQYHAQGPPELWDKITHFYWYLIVSSICNSKTKLTQYSHSQNSKHKSVSSINQLTSN